MSRTAAQHSVSRKPDMPTSSPIDAVGSSRRVVRLAVLISNGRPWLQKSDELSNIQTAKLMHGSIQFHRPISVQNHNRIALQRRTTNSSSMSGINHPKREKLNGGTPCSLCEAFVLADKKVRRPLLFKRFSPPLLAEGTDKSRGRVLRPSRSLRVKDH